MHKLSSMEAREVLDKGGVLLLQTHSFFGLVANATRSVAVEKMINHVGNMPSYSVHILAKTPEDFFKYATVTKPVQQLLYEFAEKNVVYVLPAKSPLYLASNIAETGNVALTLVNDADIFEFMDKCSKPLLVTPINIEPEAYLNKASNIVEGIFEIATLNADKREYCIIDFTKKAPKVIKECADYDVIIKRYYQIQSDKFLPIRRKFPLFRKPFLSISAKSKHDVLQNIFSLVQERYQEKRDTAVVAPQYIVTPNLDHARILIEENHKDLQQAYKEAWLQIPDGYPPFVKYSVQSLGYQIPEQVDGLDVFLSIMTRIGQEALPFTIYLVGGFQQTAYKVKDHFVSTYPRMAANFVGISEPPKGFMDNKELLGRIVMDINEKKPDFVFVCLAAPTQEIFLNHLKRSNINFGLGIGLGRVFDIIAGYQKKAPKIIEKYHLGWIYRSIVDRRILKRVLKDLAFITKELVS